MTTESIQFSVHLDVVAESLYYRYGAAPWRDLPEDTRAHFRDLVRAGVDGAGNPLTGTPQPSASDLPDRSGTAGR
ncbi:MAG: hypothetical protein QOJ30_5293 [Pseudonocardiales bacterium]|jgi:hypothetical protein|nr:hypothetical protein [Pseudonocardiales bacterium]